MGKLSIACKDMGLEWCDFEAHADNKQALIEILTVHSAKAHDLDVEALMQGEGAIMLDAKIKEVED
jgi:predicted small metal-binding protein